MYCWPALDGVVGDGGAAVSAKEIAGFAKNRANVAGRTVDKVKVTFFMIVIIQRTRMKLKFLEGLFKKIPPIEEISSRNVKIISTVILGLFTILTVSGFFEILGVKTQYNIRQFFPVYHPLLRQDEIVKEKFKINEAAPYLVVATLPHDGESDWSSKEHIDAIRTLTEKF
jgi:hypothetical protein